MFYLQLHQIKIDNNRELLGKGELKIISFVNQGPIDFPDLDQLFYPNTSVSTEKGREILGNVIRKVVGSFVSSTIYKVKSKATLTFGQTGYTVYQSEIIPQHFNWTLMVVECDKNTRSFATIAKEICAEDSNLDELLSDVSSVAKLVDPSAEILNRVAGLVTRSIINGGVNNKDDQLGYFLSSFIRDLHYADGTLKHENIPDLTNNMYLNYSIYSNALVLDEVDVPVL